jgi:hypothetical protein
LYAQSTIDEDLVFTPYLKSESKGILDLPSIIKIRLINKSSALFEKKENKLTEVKNNYTVSVSKNYSKADSSWILFDEASKPVSSSNSISAASTYTENSKLAFSTFDLNVMNLKICQY